MARITDHFGITDPVPFADVELTCDNLRYLDPHRIRTGAPHSITREAVDAIDSFFDVVARAVMSTDLSARAEGQQLLTQFTEPWETRLGMSRFGFRGHGGADDTGRMIWGELTTNLEALLEIGILKHLEHLPLFVPNVGNDITSDITTRITFGALARYTEGLMSRFPQLAREGITTSTVQVWDSAARGWSTRTVRLPTASGSSLLLVPEPWTGANLTMSPTRFYETTLLSYAQLEQLAILPNGKVAKTPKWALKKQKQLRRGRDTHRAVTMRAYASGDDLLELFRIFVDSKINQQEIS